MIHQLRIVVVAGTLALAGVADLWFVNRPEAHSVSEFNPFEAKLGKQELILGNPVAEGGTLFGHQGRNELVEVIAEKATIPAETAALLMPARLPAMGEGRQISYMATGEAPASAQNPPCTSTLKISLESQAKGELHIRPSGLGGASRDRSIELVATGTRLVAEFDVAKDNPNAPTPEGCQHVLAIEDEWNHKVVDRPLKIVAAEGTSVRIHFKPASSLPRAEGDATPIQPFGSINVRAHSVSLSAVGATRPLRHVRAAGKSSIDINDLKIGSDSIQADLGGVGWVTVNGRGVGPTFSEWLQADYLRFSTIALLNLSILFCGVWWIQRGRLLVIAKPRGWPGPAQGLRVFLCHCSEDKPTVRALWERLVAGRFTPWLDEEAIRGGHEWESEITQGLDESHAVVVCLSREFVVKTGYVQKELREAIRLSAYRPAGDIYVIPVRIEDCPIPRDLLPLQCIDLFRDGGYERLEAVLHERERQVTSERASAASG